MSAVFSALAVLQAVLCSILIAHVLLQLWLARSYLRARPALAPRIPRAAGFPPDLPRVTVQLPVYN